MKYQDFLKYLVDVSERGESPKELTIAIDFFGKDKNFDPAVDSSVRAYVSNLRKKLEHYYLTLGQADEIQVELPKGEYCIEFIQREIEPA